MTFRDPSPTPSRRLFGGIAIIALALALPGCKRQQDEPQPVAADAPRLAAGAARVDADYLASGGDGSDWPATGFNYAAHRFSPLDRIDRDNVGSLGIGWFANLPGNAAQNASPVVVDGTIYVVLADSRVAAYDAASGDLAWDYDPRIAADPARIVAPDDADILNGGIALWKGKLFTATIDGRLVALDAKTGIPLWTIQATEANQAITTAPVVVKNLVIIGKGGARGSIAAYDIVNGTLRWQFFTTPNPAGEPDNAASDPMLAVATGTWAKDGKWRLEGGGGAVSDGIVYDAALDQLYFGTGGGNPGDYGERSRGNGDNLFLSSIVAVKPETGEYLWHFQETPAAEQGFGATDPMMLATLSIDDAPRRLLLHPSRNGYLIALAREDGALVSAQPMADDVAWASGYKGGRPQLAQRGAPAKPTPGKPAASPARLGWRDGAAASFDPASGHLFVPIQRPRPTLPASRSGDGDTVAYGKGGLIAIAPATGDIVWSTTRALGGGTLATAGGLVFQGGRDGLLAAYDARDGSRLWQSDVGARIGAAPVTFMADGQQMVRS